jgi:hypothetical protein
MPPQKLATDALPFNAGAVMMSGDKDAPVLQATKLMPIALLACEAG